jgi:menaquinone-specific isochorismate synthase
VTPLAGVVCRTVPVRGFGGLGALGAGPPREQGFGGLGALGAGPPREQEFGGLSVDAAVSLLPRDGIAWVTGDRALLAWGRALFIRPGSGDRSFETAAAEVRRAFAGLRVENRVGGWGTGPIAFGAFAFDPDSSASVLVVPSTIVGRAGERWWVTTVGESSETNVVRQEPSPTERLFNEPEPPPPARRVDGPTNGRWLDAVATARSEVRDGIIDKVVLARSTVVKGNAPFSSRAIAAHLARRYPECFTFVLDGLVGASPELLVRRAGASVQSVVLGGSAARGRTPQEDAELARALTTSPKDRTEHDLAVATVRESLSPLCDGIDIEPEPSLLRLPYVQHLRTVVRGRADRPMDALELAGALHPTAATCGVPTDKALAAIRELEGLDRERYCGPVGWIDARGDGEWAIALRCAELSGDTARLFAGAGIVADSDPVAELAETELKFRPLLEALGVR